MRIINALGMSRPNTSFDVLPPPVLYQNNHGNSSQGNKAEIQRRIFELTSANSKLRIDVLKVGFWFLWERLSNLVGWSPEVW